MILGREYERFQGGPTRPPRDRIHVSLQSGRKIYINLNTYRQLGEPEAVFLYYSRERDEIAIEAANPRLSESFPLRRAMSGRGFTIYIGPFVTHFGIRISGTHRFVDPIIDENGILHLKLADLVRISRGTRNRVGQKM